MATKGLGNETLVTSILRSNTDVYKRQGKTPDKVWMNPLLFIKFAISINFGDAANNRVCLLYTSGYALLTRQMNFRLCVI